MPIEIKELHIRVTVNASEGGQTARPAGAPAGGNATPSGGNDAIVAECVEQVLYILQQKYER